MVIQIYNSLKKQKEELVSQGDKTIRMYVCGVTVYDQCHIGHARSLYIFEVIRRYLKYRGYRVMFVRNITDIDDKIINRAKELNKDWKTVVDENIALYRKDLRDLGVGEADLEPRATANVESIIEDISGLIKKGFAYEADGDVYYRVRNFPAYGKLSGQSIDKMLDGVRIEPGEKKEDPLDFALWKKSKEGEPFWESPWGQGRPGWHIECSCMSRKHLKTDSLDIHAGGRDLIFPHHENEIAQAEPLTGKPFVKYWIHHGLLTINGQKMSKSLGNFITIQEALKKYGADDLKMFFLASHYASPIDFSEDRMREAHQVFQKFIILKKAVEPLLSGANDVSASDQDYEFVANFRKAFNDAMDDDFNTAKSLGVIFEFINELNKQISSHEAKLAGQIIQSYKVLVEIGTEIFGFSFKALTEDVEELTDEIQRLLNERQHARITKDFRKSDTLRDELRNLGIIVEDSKDGQRWRKA